MSQQILSKFPKIGDILKLYGLVAKSQLSQNFILDQNVTDKIVSIIQPNEIRPNLTDSLVIEVGPGPGMLTRSLIKAGANKIIGIEKDTRFLPLLEQISNATNNQFQIEHNDVLSVNLNDLVSKAIKTLAYNPETMPIHIVGNLPFNIATPLLMTQIKHMGSQQNIYDRNVCKAGVDLTFMFQREVANRIVAKPKTCDRARISVMCQAVAGVHLGLLVPSTVFTPRPKVDAAVVRLVPRSMALPGLLANRVLDLETVVRWVFAHRRKTVRNNLLLQLQNDFKSVDALLQLANIDGNIRPQDLSTELICYLAHCAVQLNLIPKSAAVSL